MDDVSLKEALLTLQALLINWVERKKNIKTYRDAFFSFGISLHGVFAACHPRAPSNTFNSYCNAISYWETTGNSYVVNWVFNPFEKTSFRLCQLREEATIENSNGMRRILITA